VNRVKKFELTIPVGGEIEIDNNGNLLTLTYTDVETDSIKTDTVPIKGIVTYKQIPGATGKNDMIKIEYMLEIDETKKVMKEMQLKIKKQSKDIDEEAAAARF